MASYFQSFRESLMPKNLLRHALARFELLDSQALDLDNLDLAIGRNTVAEFRDVGIVLPKLERLLDLPPTFTIQKAKILLLRITIPVDFYTSSITAEVEGIDVRLRVTSKEERDQQQARKRRKADKGGTSIVPTAADLAQSFLETQPPTEKKELEEALAAESQDLGASIALSESGSEDDLTFGTGQALSLPVFLTDFMHGVADRIQVRIQGVTFQVDLEVPVDANATAPELVTFQLALEGINVEGVTVATEESEGGVPTIVHKEGKRHILLNKIRAYLISEANVFSSLARSPSMPSSLASQSPTVPEAPTFFNHPPASIGLDMSVTSDALTSSSELAQSQYQQLQDSEDAFDIPYDLDDANDHNEAEEPASSLSTPRASVYQDYTTPPTDSAIQGHDQASSAYIEPEQAPWVTSERDARSEPYLRRPGSPFPPGTPSPGASIHSGSAGTGSVHSGSVGTGSGIEDLTQSHLFSHEEVESMYMSAFEDAPSQRLRVSTLGAMPGSWDEEESDESFHSLQGSSPPLAVSSISATASPKEGLGTDSPEARSSPVDASQILQSLPATARPLTPIDTSSSVFGGTARSHEDYSSSPQEPELQPQDDVPTPRGPTRLVKEIVALDSISVYIPSHHKHIQVSTHDLGKSSPNLPGAFSVHSATPTSPGFRPAAIAEPTAEKAVDSSIEIVMKPIEIRFDASIGFLLAMVVSRLLEATQGQSSETADTSKSDTPNKTPDIKVSVEEISVQFLEKLAGVADTTKRIFEPRTTTAEFGSEVLLKASILDLQGSVTKSGTRTTETKVTIDKVKFGYANDDIISFDRQVQMLESVASTTFLSGGQDVQIKMTTSPDNSRVEVNTLPLHVKLDLQRLDETFSWFGGLSSFLNMGSSITSISSPKSPVRTVQQQQKPRGVRFEAPINPNDRTATMKENKTDLRINGLRVDVIGKECSVLLNTSALKLVNREEGLGVHFSRIRLAGPYLRNSRASEVPVVVEVADTRLEYVALPRNKDLERLLELITPSKVKFDEDGEEIMVDTLLRQRRKGSVLCLTVGKVKVEAGRLGMLACLPGLAEDLAKLGTVAKYLPEDDRPGLLTLGQMKNVEIGVDIGGRFGFIQAGLKDLELAHITVPSLVAVAVGAIEVSRNKIEELVATPITGGLESASMQKPPVLMMRMIDDMEPVLKVKLSGLNVEYRVPTIMDVLGLAEDATPQDFEASLAASVANLGDHAHAAIKGTATRQVPSSEPQGKGSKPIKVDVALKDCVIGLNPLGLTSKLAVVLTDAHLEVTPGKRNTVNATATLKKACILLVDDASLLDADEGPFAPLSHHTHTALSQHVAKLCAKGYVNICQISAAKVVVRVVKDTDGDARVEVEVRDDLLVLETCADSTQTLISLANALKPPTPPSKEIKYRTSVVPVTDLLASITADAFGKAEGDYDFDNDFAIAQELGGDIGNEDDFYGDEGDSPVGMDSQYYYRQEGVVQEELFNATSASLMEDTSDGVLLSTASTSSLGVGSGSGSDDLRVEDNYFESGLPVQGTAHRWNSKKNTYDHSNDQKVLQSPLKVCVRDVHVIWHLFDGYDWARTREVITKAVQDVEAKASERRARAGVIEQDQEEEETVIGDFLFNSIYIGIPANRDAGELAQAINHQLQGNATETESVATTNYTSATVRAAGQHRSKTKTKNLKLSRSKRHKITFELKGVNVDLVTFPEATSETMNSIDIRIQDVDVFDHVPTSTWKKFAMYDWDAGERELGASMVHIELLNTKPVPSMPASEVVLKVTILPLRLHVDQDALDFITRFFEFKDESAPIHMSPTDIPFIQRAEINDIPVKLDFKPKQVNYASLRSGRTTEFMNFIILEDARLVLRHVIMYGVSGFDRLGEQLNDIWTDNVKRTQLPGVLAGLAPVRQLVNAGSGFKELIEIPIREYRKDGRIVRSIGKGAAAFAKTTGTEVVKLGAKLAIGTQYALQGAERLLVANPQEGSSSLTGGYAAVSAAGGGAGDEWEEDEFSEERKQISLYADQPLGIIQGVRGAYASLARDLSMARDAIIAVPAEVMESQSAQGAAVAVLKRAPTIIFRPAIGATKAIGQTLLGATNSLDPHNRRRMEAKYKRH
ncbi:hypothetical protein B0T17DRAFT_61695 [Bombardia bombarda]|uniref:Autophagy-related protein 2 n=1 Tax=Bombardia bombarda TaxID=252184 RepID=A0AA39XL32_9PEZI|nr:hypothetical protein B0T17DRAFT_61695 [Bombardia bombarda]